MFSLFFAEKLYPGTPALGNDYEYVVDRHKPGQGAWNTVNVAWKAAAVSCVGQYVGSGTISTLN
jgi:hypothetical protein